MSEIEVEVGRYALRTFLITKNGPASVWVDGPRWKGGVCEAECLYRTGNLESPYFWISRHVSHHPEGSPALGCSCGIYGALTWRALQSQYPYQTCNLVTVMAAEGKTIIGPIGLRTAAARIVGFWCLPVHKKLCEPHFPDAQFFPNVYRLLDAFHLPIGDSRDDRSPCSFRPLSSEEKFE